jgi:hypothetical protein
MTDTSGVVVFCPAGSIPSVVVPLPVLGMSALYPRSCLSIRAGPFRPAKRPTANPQLKPTERTISSLKGGKIPAYLLQADPHHVELVFDQITPRENRYALSRILRTVCEHLPGRSGQVPIDQSISMCGLTTILIERVKFAEL